MKRNKKFIGINVFPTTKASSTSYGRTIETNSGIWNINEHYSAVESNSWMLTGYGLSSDKAGTSAMDIKLKTGTNTDGVYWINLPTVGPTQVYCIMDDTYSGGGWMLAMKATTGTTFNYSATYWTTTNTLNPTDLTRNNADAKYNTFNYYQGTDLMAIFPDIAVTSVSIPGKSVWNWLQTGYPSYVGMATTTLVDLFANRGTRIFIKDAKTYNGWKSGVFSSQVDIRFYGFNWTDNVNCRWGFGWNENGGGLYPGGVTGSDDVSGGIGMSSGSYSAGDRITCCQDTTGINRSARVEVYVR